MSDSSPDAVLYVDGASFNNPGPSGIGIVLIVDGKTELERSDDIGYGTNNQAEYTALIEGLQEAATRGIKKLHVRSDSQLLVKQMLGEYKVKSKSILPLRMKAESMLGRFEKVTFEHVLRGFNAVADELAKQGAEKAKARGVTAPVRELFE